MYMYICDNDYYVKMYYLDHVMSRRMTNKELRNQRRSLNSIPLPANFWGDLATYFIRSHGDNPNTDGKFVHNRSLSLTKNWSDIWEEDLRRIIYRAPDPVLGPTGISSSNYFPRHHELEQYLYYTLKMVCYFLNG